MTPFPPILLAASDGLGLDLVVWIIAGVVGLLVQMKAAKQQKKAKAREAQAPASAPAARSGGGESPTPAELAEIFKRLGADIPATPPPPPPMPHPAPAPPARKPAPPVAPRKPAAARVQPVLAQRLAKARQAAAEAAALAEAERIALEAVVPGVQSRAGETRALDTATRHTGAILPRLYAMSMRLAPLPSLPMPGLDRTHHAQRPLRAKLHGRREVRDALVAQAYLQPAKSAAR